MYVKVQVTPKAKKEKFEIVGENRFTMAIKEEAKQNMANDRVMKVMAHFFGVSEKKVKVISGHRGRSKMLSINI
ncbi:MAG: DUF167 domain-containing protein [Candidatus Pacebacteria bacterium]|nr:DUF167 domain-containing protein [Candidatus Paceibacterota bacterium]